MSLTSFAGVRINQEKLVQTRLEGGCKASPPGLRDYF